MSRNSWQSGITGSVYPSIHDVANLHCRLTEMKQQPRAERAGWWQRANGSQKPFHPLRIRE